MTWQSYWWPNLVQWVLGGAITTVVGLYLRRLARIRQQEVDRLVSVVEGMIGAAVTVPTVPKKGTTLNLRDYRKGIAVVLGVLLILLLTWASTDGMLAAMLVPLVPPELRPSVGAAAGGIATTAAVILARNGLKPTSDEDATVEPSPAASRLALPPVTPAPAATAATPPADVATVAAVAPVSTRSPFWSGVPAGEPQAVTSMVEMVPLPARSYE